MVGIYKQLSLRKKRGLKMYKTNKDLSGLFALCRAMQETARWCYEEFNPVMFYESIDNDGNIQIAFEELENGDVELFYNINSEIISDNHNHECKLPIYELIDVMENDDLPALAEAMFNGTYQF